MISSLESPLPSSRKFYFRTPLTFGGITLAFFGIPLAAETEEIVLDSNWNRVEAIAKMQELGLLHQIFYRSSCIDKDQVLWTLPDGDISKLPRGSTVFIYLSNSDQKVIVPTGLIGRTYDNGSKIVESKGLVAVDPLPDKEYNTYVSGACNYDVVTVIDPIERISPAPETQVCRGDDVMLFQKVEKKSHSVQTADCP